MGIWVFPKIMVPQNGWFIRENPMNKWMIWVPLFLETPIPPYMDPMGKSDPKSKDPKLGEMQGVRQIFT